MTASKGFFTQLTSQPASPAARLLLLVQSATDLTSLTPPVQYLTNRSEVLLLIGHTAQLIRRVSSELPSPPINRTMRGIPPCIYRLTPETDRMLLTPENCECNRIVEGIFEGWESFPLAYADNYTDNYRQIVYVFLIFTVTIFSQTRYTQQLEGTSLPTMTCSEHGGISKRGKKRDSTA